MVVKKKELDGRLEKLLEDEILKLRFIQLGGKVPSSKLFRIIANVFRETGGNTENIFLFYLIRQIDEQERKKQ